jgi:hypothetical protein
MVLDIPRPAQVGVCGNRRNRETRFLCNKRDDVLVGADELVPPSPTDAEIAGGVEQEPNMGVHGAAKCQFIVVHRKGGPPDQELAVFWFTASVVVHDYLPFLNFGVE